MSDEKINTTKEGRVDRGGVSPPPKISKPSIELKGQSKEKNTLELTKQQVDLISELWFEQINNYYRAISEMDLVEFKGMRRAVEMCINKLKCYIK